MNTFDDLAYRAPARLAIRAVAIRRRTRRLWTRSQPVIASAGRTWRACMPWLAGLALVLVYLLTCSFLERNDLAASNQLLRGINAQLAHDKTALQAQLAEAAAARTTKLIYLIEAGSTTEAKDKLSRLSMMVATEHFNLQQATGARP